MARAYRKQERRAMNPHTRLNYRGYCVEPPCPEHREWIAIATLEGMPFELRAPSEADLRRAIDRAYEPTGDSDG